MGHAAPTRQRCHMRAARRGAEEDRRACRREAHVAATALVRDRDCASDCGYGFGCATDGAVSESGVAESGSAAVVSGSDFGIGCDDHRNVPRREASDAGVGQCARLRMVAVEAAVRRVRHGPN